MIKQVIVVRKDLNMRKGKMSAQVAHASMMFITKQIMMGQSADLGVVPHPMGKIYGVGLSFTEDQMEWMRNSFAKIVVGVDDELQLLRLIDDAKSEGLVVNHVVDSGKTEFNGVPTLTCAAFGPHDSDRLDRITGALKLL